MRVHVVSDSALADMCRIVEDAALMLAAIAGCDELDPTTVNMPARDYSRALRMQTSRLRLGVPR